MNMIRRGSSFVASCLLLVAAVVSPVQAAIDYSSLTAAVDVSAVGTVLVAIAALMITVVVARWGIKKIIGFFG